MKKLFALFTSAAILTAALVSCGGDSPVSETSDEDTSAAENTAASKLPEKDFGGETFTLLAQTQSTVAWSTTTFAVEEQNGDIINDEIFTRNSHCMDKWNFNIEVVEGGNAEEVRSLITQTVLTDDPAYNAVLCGYQQQAAVAVEGLYMDVYKIPHLELERNIWDDAILRDLAIDGVSYLLTGDLILTDNDCVYTMIWNKALAADLSLDGGALYDAVRSGKWTFDLFESYCKDVGADLNGDTEYDYQDRWALLATLNDGSGDCNNGFLIASDTRYFDNSENSLTFMPNREKFVTIAERISKLLSPETGYAISYSGGTYPGLGARQAIVTWFNNKQALFLAQVMSAGAQYMRECEVDFGYLPMPKADEQQATYLTHVDSRCPVLSVPVVYKDLEFSGFVLEALCENSSELIESYYETCFSGKYTRDEESYEMLLLATDNLRYDMGIAFNFGGVKLRMNAAIQTGEGITSALASITPAVETAIDEYLAMIAES